MLLVIVPTPYVDASSAWSFQNKWKRIFVGAAGMLVELFFASICAIIWHYTDPGVINQIAYNAMLIASVTTIIFNANPLLRYDGYYILSDYLEIPNLRQKSTEYALGLIRRHIFRVKSQMPLPPVGQRILLLIYAVLSSIYRIFVGVMIVLLVVYKVPVLGVLMAIGGVASWLFVPIFQVGKYLMLSPDLHRKRIRAMGFTLAFAAAVVFVIGFIKVPTHLYFTGIVQPDNPKIDGREVSGRLRTAGDGRVVALNAHDGQSVQKGQIIVQLENPELMEQFQAMQATIDEVKDRIRQAAVVDHNRQSALESQLAYMQQELLSVQQRVDDLAVRSPFDGTLVAPNLHEMADSIVPRGTEIGEVAVLDKLVIKGNIDQADAQLATQTLGLKVDVRLAGMVQTALPGGTVTFPPAAVRELDSPSLGTLGGGDTAVDPRDPKGVKATVPQFQARVILDNEGGVYYAGQRAYVRLTLESKPLAWQWTRRLWQLIQSRDTGKWI
jgi:putative peptide zinc metalloprotease protein